MDTGLLVREETISKVRMFIFKYCTFSYHSVGWWPKPWQMRRCHQSSRTCRARTDALLASLGRGTQSNRKTQLGWSHQCCGVKTEGNRIRKGSICSHNKRFSHLWFFYLSVNDWEVIELSILVLYTYFLPCVLILNEIFLKICNIDNNSVCVF